MFVIIFSTCRAVGKAWLGRVGKSDPDRLKPDCE